MPPALFSALKALSRVSNLDAACSSRLYPMTTVRRTASRALAHHQSSPAATVFWAVLSLPGSDVRKNGLFEESRRYSTRNSKPGAGWTPKVDVSSLRFCDTPPKRPDRSFNRV